MRTPNYAVIFSYSFDDEVVVYLFEKEKEAVNFLRDSFEEELRIDIQENGWNAVGHISDNGWSAKIVTDLDDTIYFKIGIIYQ